MDTLGKQLTCQQHRFELPQSEKSPRACSSLYEQAEISRVTQKMGPENLGVQTKKYMHGVIHGLQH